jgi:hypothetical protein
MGAFFAALKKTCEQFKADPNFDLIFWLSVSIIAVAVLVILIVKKKTRLVKELLFLLSIVVFYAAMVFVLFNLNIYFPGLIVRSCDSEFIGFCALLLFPLILLAYLVRLTWWTIKRIRKSKETN